ncbi:hypothetical protein HANVADRAFT_52386 [Hanseniaspora valbyensis NRRL Y-1626]|uniref:DM2 domain-containing protein n=1 Tax=Hanseniaspora valbyensis NRRL Y-1626 TaxID=766949 RepID=A0A1B7TFB9_9ASCO|nr:hypothetical protein HANVADRAFT_52386 [Hanseniaspora valbyensis NRRL Y-1626]
MSEESDVNLFQTLANYKKQYEKKQSVLQYIPMIDCIVNVGDLDLITVSKILKAIVNLYGDSVLKNSDQLKELIYERFYHFQKLYNKNDKKNVEENHIKKRKADDSDKSLEKEKSLKKKIKKESKKESVHEIKQEVKKDEKKKKKKAKKLAEESTKDSEDDKPLKKGGFALTPVTFSEKLINILGENQPDTGEPWTRTKVSKAVWDYIKDKELQNPEDKRDILFKKDSKFSKLFPDDIAKVSMFSMQKYISPHIKTTKDLV